MLKRSIILSLIFLSAKAMDNSQMRVSKSSLQVSHKLGALALARDNNGFHVFEGNKKTTIKPYDVDPMLRTMNPEQFKEFQKVGYLTLKQLSNKDYKLNAHVRGNGGGAIGAQVGFWTGKFGTQAACYGAIAAVTAAVSAVATPAVGSVVGTALTNTLFVPIEALSNTVGLGTGILLATATGPV